jgi:hypothetical protein
VNNVVEVLAAQTLALTYNIGKINGYNGQTMSVLGCGAKVTSALTALGLTSTTQTQAGDMNALLGNCVHGDARLDGPLRIGGELGSRPGCEQHLGITVSHDARRRRQRGRHLGW